MPTAEEKNDTDVNKSQNVSNFGSKSCKCPFKLAPVTKLSVQRLKQQAGIIKALAHPSRLLAIQALSQKELCVCELKEIIGFGMSTVSEHLSILKSAGLVSETKKGLYVYYSLTLPCVLQFLSCIDAVLDERIKKEHES